ncbi:2OG-Fe(II) oxygenase [Pleomorphomonas oryzae]|uniref:2OG-Fe(II) oxygenase n=1 Tax=Pleomorphomonas oryzae TaxID=261934 RepID=UPI0012EBD04B|nr:2OG-Fe(II) oxygenase [Pleomorphomonas oryzae]
MNSYSTWRPYHSWDILGAGLLPPHWDNQISHTIREHSIKTILTGEGSTSRETKKNQKIPVYVVDGSSINASLPWLMTLYAGPLLNFASRCQGKELFVAVDQKSSVNINHIEGIGSRYEWHVDSNPVTGLLFCTTCNPRMGGALVFRNVDEKRNAVVWPRKGLFICFDARNIPHRVAPLRGHFSRISIPMNYYDSNSVQKRPDDLDVQIYTPSEE